MLSNSSSKVFASEVDNSCWVADSSSDFVYNSISNADSSSDFVYNSIFKRDTCDNSTLFSCFSFSKLLINSCLLALSSFTSASKSEMALFKVESFAVTDATFALIFLATPSKSLFTSAGQDSYILYTADRILSSVPFRHLTLSSSCRRIFLTSVCSAILVWG